MISHLRKEFLKMSDLKKNFIYYISILIFITYIIETIWFFIIFMKYPNDHLSTWTFAFNILFFQLICCLFAFSTTFFKNTKKYFKIRIR